MVAAVAAELDAVGLSWLAMLRPQLVMEGINTVGRNAGPKGVARRMREQADDTELDDTDTILKRGLEIMRRWYPEDSDLTPPTFGGPKDMPVAEEWGFLIWIGAISDFLEEDLPGSTNALIHQREWAENAYQLRFTPGEIAQYIVLKVS